MINAFIKHLKADHIVDCVAEINHAKKQGNKLKEMCLNSIFDYYEKGEKKWRRWRQ